MMQTFGYKQFTEEEYNKIKDNNDFMPVLNEGCVDCDF